VQPDVPIAIVAPVIDGIRQLGPEPVQLLHP
jgi:hypothetical protein